MPSLDRESASVSRPKNAPHHDYNATQVHDYEDAASILRKTAIAKARVSKSSACIGDAPPINKRYVCQANRQKITDSTISRLVH
jgi:hypothetical protein